MVSGHFDEFTERRANLGKPFEEPGTRGKTEGLPSDTAACQIECDGLWKVFGSNADAALSAIRAENLSKDEAQQRFDCVIGVSDASLRVQKGEIFCIMGLSGSGKSTLLRHINRLIEPTAGRVMIDGKDISRLDRKGLARLRSETIGMVFQHMALWPHRSIRDNVAYGLEVRGVDRKHRNEAAERVLAQVKLSGWENHYPDELSGGMQQRVGLARALAADPDILLMDEPFSALDPLIRTELQDQFLELSTAVHKTTLFITHDLEEAIRLGHRVAIMKDGVIVQVGTPEDILTNPADDYVESFVKGISRLRFITAGRVMIAQDRVGNLDPLELPAVHPDAGLRELIDSVNATGGPIAVRDGDQPVGIVTPHSLLDAIKGRLRSE